MDPLWDCLIRLLADHGYMLDPVQLEPVGRQITRSREDDVLGLGVGFPSHTFSTEAGCLVIGGPLPLLAADAFGLFW